MSSSVRKALSMAATMMAAAAVTFAAGPAMATAMVGKVTGALASGSDILGDFGTPGSLTGEAFTLDFTYDTDLFTPVIATDYVLFAQGGERVGAPSLFTSMSLTIKGVTQAIDTHYFEQMQLTGFTTFFVYAGASADEALEHVNILADGPPGAADFSRAWSTSTSTPGGGFRRADGGAISSEGSFGRINLSIAPAAPAPEPAAWASMILGLTVAGAALRARRRAPAVA